jgi:hypothetical protein
VLRTSSSRAVTPRSREGMSQLSGEKGSILPDFCG